MTWENNCMVTMQTSDWWDEVGKEGRLPAWSGGWQPPPSRSSSWLVQPHWLGHCALTRWHTTTLPHSAGLSHFHSGSHYQTITKPHLPRPHIRMEGGNLASEHLEQYHPAQKNRPCKEFWIHNNVRQIHWPLLRGRVQIRAGHGVADYAVACGYAHMPLQFSTYAHIFSICA